MLRSKVKVQGHRGQKNEKNAESSPLTMHAKATRALGRTLHAAADDSIVWPPVGDGVTAVHVDGGLHAVLSGAVLAGAATPVGKSAHAIHNLFVSLFVS